MARPSNRVRGPFRWLFAAWLFVIAVVAAGCLGSGESITIAKLGLIAPVQGIESGLGMAMLHGAQLAVDEQNALGGVGGRRILLLTQDEGVSVDQGRSEAMKMVLDPDVFSVLGYTRPETLNSGRPVLERAGLRLIPFRDEAAYGSIAGQILALSVAGASITIIAPDSGPDAALARALSDRSSTIRVETLTTVLSRRHAAELAATAEIAGADILVVGGPPAGAANLALELGTGRTAPAVCGFQCAFDEFNRAAGDSASGWILVRDGPDIDDVDLAGSDFHQRFTTQAHFRPTPAAWIAYSRTLALLRAVDAEARETEDVDLRLVAFGVEIAEANPSGPALYEILGVGPSGKRVS